VHGTFRLFRGFIAPTGMLLQEFEFYVDPSIAGATMPKDSTRAHPNLGKQIELATLCWEEALRPRSSGTQLRPYFQAPHWWAASATLLQNGSSIMPLTVI
jgi:hypothetical protein